MSQKQNLYTEIWRRQSVPFKKFLESDDTTAEVQLQESWFQHATVRGRQDFSFNLVIENGRVTNNISGSAVARDLYDYLSEHALFRRLLKNMKVKFNMTGEFVLQMRKL